MNATSIIKIVISSLLLAIFSQICLAQEPAEIKGTVRSTTGEFLPGATVVVEGTAQGVITNVEGKFSLKARKGQMLKVSFVGMKTRVVNHVRYNEYNTSRRCTRDRGSGGHRLSTD